MSLPYLLDQPPERDWQGLSALQYKPQWRTVYAITGSGPRPFYLPWPWVQFFIEYAEEKRNIFRAAGLLVRNVRVFYSFDPVTGWDSPVWGYFLPNQSHDSAVCLGNYDNYFRSSDELVRFVIGKFWSSPFTYPDIFQVWQDNGKPTYGLEQKLRAYLPGWTTFPLGGDHG